MLLLLEIMTGISLVLSIYAAYLSIGELFGDRYLNGKLEFFLIMPMVFAFWIALISVLAYLMYALFLIF